MLSHAMLKILALLLCATLSLLLWRQEGPAWLAELPREALLMAALLLALLLLWKGWRRLRLAARHMND